MAFTKEIGLKDFYEYYLKVCERKDLKPHSYKVYSTVIKDFNKRLRHKIIYESEIIKLPYRLGDLYIHKYRNNYCEENRKGWKINFKATKELGHVVYHGAVYGYRWKWNKIPAIIKGKRWYRFRACRTASRMIADAVNNKQIDFYH